MRRVSAFGVTFSVESHPPFGKLKDIELFHPSECVSKIVAVTDASLPAVISYPYPCFIEGILFKSE